MKKYIPTIAALVAISVPLCIGTVVARHSVKAETMPRECVEAEIQTETFIVEEIINQVEKPSEIVTEEVTEAVTEPQLISLGIFKVTAYCSCSLCCSHYAENRPLDENGEPIVYGASGEELIADYSIAADLSIIPFNEVVLINGKEYICHDVGSAIFEKRIDIFMESHSAALEWGVQYIEIFKVVNKDVLGMDR